MDLAASERRNYLGMAAELTKARLTAMVTLTTAMGYLMAAGRLNGPIVLPMLGVFLLASGAVALNQCQEAALDARMERTRGRPIPSGRLGRTAALFVGLILALIGLFCLASIPIRAQVPLALGGFALLWYNGVYTPLKRITAFAVVPGALLGAVGPMIGWTAAGGQLSDPLILLVGSFFFVWQIPHFWLLVLIFGEQYGRAGLPSPAQTFDRPQLFRITFMWVTAAAAMGLMLVALSRGSVSRACGLAVIAASAWLVLKVARLLTQGDPDEPRVYRRAFVQVNVYGLAVMACLTLNSLTAGV